MILIYKIRFMYTIILGTRRAALSLSLSLSLSSSSSLSLSPLLSLSPPLSLSSWPSRTLAVFSARLAKSSLV